MTGLLRIGMMMMAGGLLLPLAACSRTSDGTIVAETPVVLPSLHLAPKQKLVPFWAKREAEPVVESNFPPAPRTGAATPRRKARPPLVVTSGSGNLACKNVGESGRVRMVCE